MAFPQSPSFSFRYGTSKLQSNPSSGDSKSPSTGSSPSDGTWSLCGEATGKITSVFFSNPTKVEEFIKIFFKNGYTSTKGLLSLALTCKTIYEPIMNIIWEKLDTTLLPLLKIIPTLTVIGNSYVLSGPTTPDNISRFQSYAYRVKEIIDSGSGSIVVSPSTYLRLSQLVPSPILPSLSNLATSCVDMTLSHIFLFLSPSLKTLSISKISGDCQGFMSAFCNTVPSIAPLLSNLTLQGPTTFPPDQLQFISQCTNLQALTIRNFVEIKNFDLIRDIGKLPHLKKFLFETEYYDVSYTSAAIADGTTGFEQLTDISLTVPYQVLQDFIQYAVPAPLLSAHLISTIQRVPESSPHVGPAIGGKKSKSVGFGHVSSSYETALQQKTEEWYGSLRTMFDISMSCSQWSSLRFLHIGRLNTNLLAGEYSFKLPVTAMSPLRRLRSLERFTICDWDFLQSDEDFQSIIKSWPELKSMNIPRGPKISLNTLQSIAESCPHLTHLDCSLDVTIMPVLNHSPALSHGLESLVVESDYPATKNLKHVARYLNLLFPDIRSIGKPSQKALIGQSEWLEVLSLVQLLQEVRKDDEARRANIRKIANQQ